MFYRALIIGLFLLFPTISVLAQSQDDSTGTAIQKEPPAPIEKPTGFYADHPLDSSHTQNPTIALFKSMFVPGLGQIGNKKYIKAAVIIGIEGSLIASYIHNANRASDAKQLYDNNTDTSLSYSLYKKYKTAKDDRNFYGWMTGLTIFISMFDAYVDAHLAHFPKYDKGLAFKLGPDKRSILSARLSYSF
jgi:hypothetical protein